MLLSYEDLTLNFDVLLLFLHQVQVSWAQAKLFKA